MYLYFGLKYNVYNVNIILLTPEVRVHSLPSNTLVIHKYVFKYVSCYGYQQATTKLKIQFSIFFLIKFSLCYDLYKSITDLLVCIVNYYAMNIVGIVKCLVIIIL